MAKAHKLPSGSWRVRVFAGYTSDGKREYKSFTHADKNEAEFQAAEFKARHKQVARDTSNMTLNEAMGAYINARENILSPATIRGYENIRRNHITTLSNSPLKKISTNELQQLVNIKSKTLSAKTVANIHGFINVVMQAYAPRNIIGRITLPQKKKSRSRALNKQEISLLLKSIDGHKIEVPILLALWLGLRRSEILALKWNDINFAKKTLRIDEAIVLGVGNKMVLKNPKTTDSERTLIIPPYILQKLENLPKDTEFVFTGNGSQLTKGFPKLCNDLGIEHCTFHDLRRSMATIGLSLNIADKVMMARGGWNDISTMKKVYQMVLQETENDADLAMNAYFEKLMHHDM